MAGDLPAPAPRGFGGHVAALPFALFGLAVLVAVLETASSGGFSPDSMLYVDVARQIVAGRGVATDIVFVQGSPTALPAPLSLWPPLFPVMIAGLSRLGLAPSLAARIIPIASFGLLVVAIWLMGSVYFDPGIGTLSALLLVVWPPMLRVAAMAWSESPFTLLLLLSTLVTLAAPRSRLPAPLGLVAGGLVMGAAALTRYAGLACIPLGGLAVAASYAGRPWAERVKAAIVWVLSASLPVAAWLWRNILLTGTPLGTGRTADRAGIVFHAAYAARTLAADGLRLVAQIAILPSYLPSYGGSLALAAVFLALGLTVLVAWLRRSSRLRHVLEAGTALAVSPAVRYLLIMGVGYCAVMLAARSRVAFDPLTSRILMPAYPFLLLGGLGTALRSMEAADAGVRRLRQLLVALCLTSLVAVTVPRSLAAGGPTLAPRPAPEAVQWVAAHTPRGSLIVGNYAYDYNFYLQRPVVEFHDYPYGISRFDCRSISAILTRVGTAPAYFVLRRQSLSRDAESLRERYPPMIRTLLDGQSALPLRLMVRSGEIIAYEVLDTHWPCD